MPRLSNGPKRPIPFQLNFNLEEEEYSKRVSIDSDTSRAELLRNGFFKPNWRLHLKTLRIKQKGLPKRLLKELNHDQ